MIDISIEGISFSGKTSVIQEIMPILDDRVPGIEYIDYTKYSDKVSDIISYPLNHLTTDDNVNFLLESALFTNNHFTYKQENKPYISERGILSVLAKKEIPYEQAFMMLAHMCRGFPHSAIIYLDIDPRIVAERCSMQDNNKFIEEAEILRNRQKNILGFMYEKTNKSIPMFIIDGSGTTLDVAKQVVATLENIRK